MRGLALCLIALTWLGCGSLSREPGLIKVLPHYLDKHGRHTTGVTLVERDMYQLELRKDPAAVHGVRYNVNWRGNAEMTVRLELRSTKAGVAPLTFLHKDGQQWGPFEMGDEGDEDDEATFRSMLAANQILHREQTATPKYGSTWTPILIDVDTYKKFGQPESWRVTLWQNGEQVAEQASFLW